MDQAECRGGDIEMGEEKRGRIRGAGIPEKGYFALLTAFGDKILYFKDGRLMTDEEVEQERDQLRKALWEDVEDKQ